jgi:PleD family two-component response regulator
VADVESDTWDSAVALADDALYAAKQAGRNRVFGPNGVQVQAA